MYLGHAGRAWLGGSACPPWHIAHSDPIRWPPRTPAPLGHRGSAGGPSGCRRVSLPSERVGRFRVEAFVPRGVRRVPLGRHGSVPVRLRSCAPSFSASYRGAGKLLKVSSAQLSVSARRSVSSTLG